MATNTEKIVVQVVVQGEKDLQKLERRTGSTTKSFGKMAGGILAAVTAFKTITSVIGSAIKSFRDFEFQMAKVKAVTGASNSDFKKLSSSAKELGRTTFFTAQQVAELQTNYAKLGFTTEEILNAQEATLQLATATDSDLARAAIVAGSAVRGFGLDASETQRVVDVMAVAFTSSALDIEKFQTSMTKVAPIAKSAGFSIEDTTAIMSQLADSGIEASIAGTSLRNILLKMQDPNSDLVKSFGKTIHSLDDLVPALAKFSEEGGSLAEIMEVVDLRQAAAFEQMITSRQRTVDLRDSLLEANGAAADMAETVGDNMEGAFKRFTSALEGLAINITEGFIGQAVTGFLENVTGILTFINDFIDTSKSLDEVTAETAGSLLQESIELQKLANEYDNLNSKINKSTSDRVQMAAILDTLESKLGDSVIAIDKETGSLILNRDALDEVIARTALLANEEAIKLVHSIRLTEKEIDKQTGVLDKNSDSLRRQNLLLKEQTKTQDDKTKSDLVSLSSMQQMTNAEGELIDLRRDENVINKQVAEQQKVVNSLKDQDRQLTSELNELESKRSSQIALLLEQGFTMAQVEELMTTNIEKSTQQTNQSTTAITTNTQAKQLNNDVDREMLDFRVTQMMMGYLKEEEIADLQRDLKKREIADLRNLLKVQGDIGVDRAAIAQRIFDLEKDLSQKSQKQKDLEFAEDVKRAAMSGESASDAAKRLIRAKIMEAVSIYIVGAFSANPLLGAIVAAGAGSFISSIFENAFAGITFAKGGMIEEFANGGMVHGRSHAQGGEKFAVGGRVVELEGGEAVINKRSTSMFRNQLSAMNAAGGGVKFADGGLLNMPSFSQQQFNALGQSQMMGAMGSSGKVVVVEADITDSQNTVNVIQSEATI